MANCVIELTTSSPKLWVSNYEIGFPAEYTMNKSFAQQWDESVIDDIIASLQIDDPQCISGNPSGKPPAPF